MLAPQTYPAALRKGTRSCTECRRRKVRCVRIPEDAPTCRQCTERNTTCLAQTTSSRPRQAARLPSRYRITQLESQVNQLTKIVTGLEVKLGGKPSIPLEQGLAHSPGLDDSDGESSTSENLIAEEPSQLRSLFQNDWLSVDTRRQHAQRQQRREKASVHLLETVRPALQKLIPSRGEMAEMMVCTLDWLHIVQGLLPPPSLPCSQQEMVYQYEAMCAPDVDVIVLASWLLTLAITAQQIPQGNHPTEVEAMKSQRRLRFARAVSDAVERLIMTHDRLVGTLQGLEMAIQFIRLQIGRGNPQKAWIKLRHVIALAELMGLPKVVHITRLKKPNGDADEATQQKVQLWDLICTIDRLAGMLINLPPYTKRYPLLMPAPVTVNGVVQPSEYIRRLVDIAPKLQDLEELSVTQGPTPKLYTSALEIARESWWVVNIADELKSGHIVQFIHYVIIMKAYVPIALRQDQTEEYLYSRLACMDACESVACRYQFLRRKLPSGFFALRLLDLQVFTAMVLLLLTSHTCPSQDQRSFQIDKTRLKGVVSQVIHLMEEKSKEGVGSDFAEHGATTIRALQDLLQQDDIRSSRMKELAVNVPLMGKIHVRRNFPAAQSSGSQDQPSSDPLARLVDWNAQSSTVPNPFNTSRSQGSSMQDVMAETGMSEMQLDNLSWSIEDASDNFFDEALMEESFDQFALWQNSGIQQQSVSQKSIPNGGFEAWLTVVAGFCVFVNSWGIISTYGAFQEFYLTVLLPEESPSSLSWVGSIQATLLVMVGIVTGPLVDLGYLRPLIVTGSFLTVFGVMMTSLSTEYYQVLLAQGFCVGIGGGIAYIPALVVISTYFTTKRPIAIGCASIGSSVGSVIFPIMFRQLQPRIGFPWTVRSIGFISLGLAVITCAVLCRKPGEKVGARSLIEWKAFKDVPFMLFSVSLTLVMLAYWIPLFYVASYARTVLGTTRSLSFYMVSIINGASAFGRTVPYLVGSRVKPICVLISCIAGSAIAMFTWIAATSTPGFIVWACYWGFLTGVIVTAPTSIISHPALCPDMKMLGTRMGMMWGISSFGSLAGTPIAGALVDLSEAQFLRAQIFAGCLMLGAVTLQLWPTLVVIRHDRQRAR
ncbi:major facilitator superfamily domain-containing protein [Aspergillus egyptiacus]|nr:major facilitator superfamily domain-containing protein [Aspergillus egyptiacus]